ncbi:DNA-binding transcriptional ArsR family regulator [Kineosporia succinea]|uniref:DNA-binding transcriptional ArsR family regulator n=1 Tax=Kineosporia succinea TaxID=84632 RepID=A0ABT9P6Z4_9ACTN|nr:DNA-binding transcriptional ArsR family regulator [Kineosporia succinea]
MGYLLVDESEGVSPSELAEQLGVSAGSVSGYTRALVERGFVRRAGERSHYSVMDEDVWAGFLAAEQQYLASRLTLAEQTLPHVTEGTRAWHRVRNMRDYWPPDRSVSSRSPSPSTPVAAMASSTTAASPGSHCRSSEW